MSILPGIRYDLREPPPPEFGQVNLYAASTVQPHPMNPKGRSAGVDPSDSRVEDHFPPHDAAYHTEYGIGALGALPPVRKRKLTEEGFLPPLSATVKAQIVHDTANFVVTHLFSNQSDAIRQGTYQFPLPLEATVTSFTCRVGPNKIVRGEVKAKEDARRDFKNAVQENRIAGLVEQQTAEIFTTTLGNIPADTEVKAELSFICLLKHRSQSSQEVFTLTIPTFIAPRYGDPPPGVKMSVQGPQFLNVHIDLLTAEEIISVVSDTHAITVEKGSGQRPCQRWEDFVSSANEQAQDTKAASIHLQKCTALDRDFVLDIHTTLSSDAEAPHACLEIHPTFKNHKAVMLTIPSQFMLQTETQNRNGEIIFVADRSGSMDDKMASLKSAMMFFINGIPYGRLFNIWCFGSSFTSLWTHSRPLNEESKNEATTYVQQQFCSNMGGTEILSVLQAVCQASNIRNDMDVIVLTDGEVWRPGETIDFVKRIRQQSRSMARFFSLGIGAAVSHELVEGIAKAGGGYAEIIPSASSGGWEDRIVAVLKAALTGHVGSLQVELCWKKDSSTPDVSYKQSPPNSSEISPFTRNRLYLLFDNENQTVELEAVNLKVEDTTGFQILKRVEVMRLHRPDSAIHKLAAGALLCDIERSRSDVQRHNSFEISPNIDQGMRDEAIYMGCKWSLVSIWTSLVAIEERWSDDEKLEALDIGIADAGEDHFLQSRGAVGFGLLQPTAGSVIPSFSADPSFRSGISCYGRPPYSPMFHGSHSRSPDEHDLDLVAQLFPPGPPPPPGGHPPSHFSSSWSPPLRDPSPPGHLFPPPSYRLRHSGPSFPRDPPPGPLSSSHFSPPPPPPPPPLLPSLPPGGCSASQGFIRQSSQSSQSYRQAIYRRGEDHQIPPELNLAGYMEKFFEEEAARDFIQTILPFQNADGSFVFQKATISTATFGAPFMDVVSKIDADLKDQALTIAIVALLEKHFQNCKGLWELMVRKAKEYLAEHCPDAGALLEKARSLVEPVAIVPKSGSSQEKNVDTSVELEVAPVV